MENNKGKKGYGSKTPHPSNTGASTKLKKASAGGAPGSVGTMGKVSNKNPYPNGMC
jgi:hypothetical protein